MNNIFLMLFFFCFLSMCSLIDNMAIATKNIVAELNKWEKLNGDNFDVWHRRVQYILEEQEYLEALHYTMSEPEYRDTPHHQKNLEAYQP